MMFINKREIFQLSDILLEQAIDSLLETRPDFKKIFASESLGIYAVGEKILKSKTETTSIDLCTVLPPSGCSAQELKAIHSSNLGETSTNFKKSFYPKAHLFFTNSLVAGQLAIDFQTKGHVQTLNPTEEGFKQLFSYMNLKTSSMNKDQSLLGIIHLGSRVIGVRAYASDETGRIAVHNLNEFAAMAGVNL